MRRCPKCNSFFDNSVEECIYDGEKLVEVQVEAAQNDGLEGAVVNDRYEVETSIGEGGMGMVYRAQDRRTGDKIALKVLHSDISGDERTVRRFFSEARVLASLTHPNIIRLYDFGKTDEGLLYIAMELLNGKPVDELIRLGEISQMEALEIIDQTAAALGEAHLQGVIHRDLKPANIFMDKADDGSVKVTVLDFGIAKIAGSGQNLTATGKVMGTPSYMAPEQIRGQDPDPRTDIYALGAMGYELLSGQPPFIADGPIAVLFMHLERAPTPLDTLSLDEPVSAEIARTFEGFLAKDPADRPRNMMDVRSLLKPLLDPDAQPAEVSPELPGDPDVYKRTVPFDAEKAVAEAKRRAEENKRKELPRDVTSDATAAVNRQSDAADPRRKPAVVAASTPKDLPEETQRMAHPPADDEGNSLAMWIGALFIVILLAAALAVGVFFYFFPSSSDEQASDHSRPAIITLAEHSQPPTSS